MGIQFQRGKWLRLSTGNTFGDIPNDKVKKVGKSTCYCMCFSSIFCFVLSYGIFRDNSKILCFMTIFGFIIGSVGIIYALNSWVKNG